MVNNDEIVHNIESAKCNEINDKGKDSRTWSLRRQVLYVIQPRRSRS